jgi:hypothetical protein
MDRVINQKTPQRLFSRVSKPLKGSGNFMGIIPDWYSAERLGRHRREVMGEYIRRIEVKHERGPTK